jgi:excisionase family DNA binding protein
MGMIHEEEELFTTAEAAKELRVHPSTVRKLAKDGVIARREPSGRRGLLVTADSVRAFKEARKLDISDLATRLLLLERKVDLFITSQAVAQSDDMLTQISAVLEKNHPHMG